MTDGPPRDFEESYRSGDAPWEIGRPQAELVRLAEAGRVVGSVLDVGCGTGENALYLAARGHAVFGVDGSETAIQRAREKAAARGLGATQFHVFPDPQRREYAHALAEVTASGSDLFILCWSDEEPPGPGPRRVAEHEIRDAFRSIFAVMDVVPAGFERRGAEPARAWLAHLTKI